MLNKLTESLGKNPDYPERLASRLGERLRFIELAQVTHFYAEDKLTFAVVEGKSHSIDHSIVQLEKKAKKSKYIKKFKSKIYFWIYAMLLSNFYHYWITNQIGMMSAK